MNCPDRFSDHLKIVISVFVSFLRVATLFLILFTYSDIVHASSFIVKDGQPCAEIVIGENPPRMAKFAAQEFRTYIRKISGAELPITWEEHNGFPVKIYIGKSKYTERLNIQDGGLGHGAFRMISGTNWMVLLGFDRDFTPPEPWARERKDWVEMLAEWDEITGTKLGSPIGDSIFRSYSPDLGFWQFDRRGSLNAVYEYLRSLGVRWYMPGELGEVVPQVDTIEVPDVNKTILPDFALRQFHYAFYATAGKDDILWYLRLRLNHGEEVIGYGDPGHGMRNVHARDEMKKDHPEYYALWGGKRATEHHKNGAACLSAEGLFQENVRYVRALFDTYDEPMVSVMPQDGYASICECELCKGKDTPERGKEGQISDYVWGYVDRVAREVYKTHPNKKISCFAYGTYTLPPEKIDKLSPNLVVGIVQPRRFFYESEKRQHFLELRKQWLEKSSAKKLLIWDHYPFTLPGKPWEGIPAFFPHLIADDLRSLKGVAAGEFIEVMFDPDKGFGLHAPGFNHLNLYITAMLYWDADQDVDAMLDDYYHKFYGPAAVQMKTFGEFCEKNYPLMLDGGQKIDEARLLLDAAQNAAGDTIYARRIDQLNDFMKAADHRWRWDKKITKSTKDFLHKVKAEVEE